MQSGSFSDILHGKIESPISSQLRRRIDGCDVFGERQGSHPGKKNISSDLEDTGKKGRAIVTPSYAGSSNPITNPDSKTINAKVHHKNESRAALNHGDIIRDPPAPDKFEMRRSKNDSASREISKKHNNGDIITGVNQGFTNFGKGRYEGASDIVKTL